MFDIFVKVGSYDWVNGLFNIIYIKIIIGFLKCVVFVRKIYYCIFNRVKKF